MEYLSDCAKLVNSGINSAPNNCRCGAGSLLPSDRVRKLGKTRLRIDDVGASDNGVYSCSARNIAGSVDSNDNFVLSIYGTGG